MKTWKVFTVLINLFEVKERNVKIKIYFSFYSSSEIGTLTFNKTLWDSFFFVVFLGGAKVNNKLKKLVEDPGAFKKYICSRGKGDSLLKKKDK